MPHHYAIFSAQFAPHVGGVELFSEHLAQALVDTGNAATVLTLRVDASPEVELCENGTTVFRLPGVSLLGGRLPLAVKNARYREMLAGLKSLGADRVLVNTHIYPHAVDGLRFAHAVGAPALVLEHGSAYMQLGNAAVDRCIARYEDGIMTRMKKHRPAFAGVSRRSAEWLGHFGVHTNTVIPNAIDAAAFRAGSSQRSFRNELGLAPQAFVVAFTGRLIPEKGIDTLVEAATKLQGEHVPVVFLVAGEGPERMRFEGKQPPNLVFLGSLTSGDIPALLQEADCFCFPSRYPEGLPTSLLEAAACTCCIVSTDVGGAADIIPSKEYGIILEEDNASAVAEAIRTFLAMSHEERQAMGACVQHHIEEHFSWSSTVACLDAAFAFAESKA